MKAAFIVGGLALLVFAVASPAVGQDAPAQGSAITWNDTVARKSLELKRVVTQIPASQPVGVTGFGLLCMQGEPILLTRTGDMDPRDYRQRFNNETSSAGYNGGTGGGTSDSLFDDVRETKPMLQVAAAITALDIKTCVMGAKTFAPASARSTATMTIEWQVLDPLERKIVFRGTTRSDAKVSEHPRGASEAAMGAAFSSGIRALLAMPEFQQVTAMPGQQSAPLIAAAAPPVTWIPGLPLSTAPLTQHLKAVQAQVVTIRMNEGHGSGFYIADGLILTNQHVAGAEGSMVKVRFTSGKEIIGQTVASNARRDVALVKTTPVDAPGLPIRRELPEVGSQVYVIGSPRFEELEGTLSAGIVSAIRTLEHDKNRYIQSDVHIQGGNSGGPMFDDKGNIIGVTVAGFASFGVQTGLNLFIPIAEALDTLGIAMLQPAENAVTKASMKNSAP